MSALQLLPINGELLYTFDFSAEVPDAVTVDSIDYTLPSQLESFADVDALASKKGTIGLRATATGTHGMTLQVEATANLSNSEKVVQYLTVRLSGS